MDLPTRRLYRVVIQEVLYILRDYVGDRGLGGMPREKLALKKECLHTPGAGSYNLSLD